MQFPLSSHQERLWFIDQFETGNVYPESPTYHNIPLLLRGRGPLEAARVAAVLRALAARHGALRTRIVSADGSAVQRIEPAVELPVPVLGPGRGSDHAAAFAAALAEAQRPFHLATDLLVRAALLPFARDEFVLLVTVHHLVADRASVRLMAEELAALLRAEAGGVVSPLAEPELQYADFSEWQRELTPAALEPLLFYWKWQLRGRLPALELPAARPRPAVHTFTAARHEFHWDATLAAGVKQLATAEQAEPAAVVLAAFLVLLHRYARQDEIVIGTSASGRRQPGAADIVGPVSNLVVLRQRLDEKATFRSLLTEVTRTLREAHEHQEMPFDRLVLALNPAKDMSRTALFDVLFNYEGQPAPELDLGGGTSARLIDTNLGYGKNDLHLLLQATANGGLEGALVYNADFHDAWFVAQMMDHLGSLVRAIVANPATLVADLPLLSPDEERRQIVAWNDTAASAPRDRTLHDLFAAQVRRTPDRPAVVHEGEQVTYAELDARANRLAHHLRSLGVAPDTLVAVCLERSIELVATLLAVLKAGGAYLPLDPAYPAERLAFTLEDAQVAHLVTTSALVPLVGGNVRHVVRLDADAAAIATGPATAVADEVRPENLAYCIYTSGSTGRPKGALIEHRQVVRLMINDRLPFTFGPDDTWTLFHSCCFDFSVWEMYGALLYGGRLVVVPRATAQDPAAFADLVGRERVTVLNQTPTSFYQFAREVLRRGRPDLALRCVIFGGEALLPLHLREFKAAWPAVRLVNMYGITETTVHVTVMDVGDEEIAQNLSCIGRPIPTTTVYLTDERQRLLPPGVPGEICVGGEGVGRGYLRRDELTSQRFVPSPFRAGERLYRSGDLARYLADGRLVYLGRIDDQVQIRGFRVEPGEIQTRLLQHPAVREVEIVARPWRSDTLELIAYLVLRTEVADAELRRHLVETLPDYMVPAAIMRLSALPLTSNGKVDRRALPEPGTNAGAAAGESLAPRNPTEEKLAALWAEVLRRPQVGVRESFFELGGHSLLATQLMNRVREAFGVELPLRHLFEAPTVEAFAAVVAAQTQAAAPAASAGIPRAARRTRTATVES